VFIYGRHNIVSDILNRLHVARCCGQEVAFVDVPWKKRRKSVELANLKVCSLARHGRTDFGSHRTGALTACSTPDVGSRDVERKSI
jgi:hypothetical protein